MENKPGYTSTAFLILALNSVGSLAMSAAGVLPPKYAALATTVSGVAYAFANAWVKRPTPVAPVVPAVPISPEIVIKP